MHHFHPNRRYNTIAIYACCACTAVLAALVLLLRVPDILGFLGRILAMLTPVFYGFIFAYLLDPIVKLCEKPFGRLSSRVAQRLLAIGLTYICLGVLVFLVVYFLFPLLLGDTQLLGSNMLLFLEKALTFVSSIAADYGVELTPESVQQALTQHWQIILQFFSSYGAQFLITTYQLFLGAVMTVGILFYKEHILASMRRLVAAFLPARACALCGKVARYSDNAFGSYVVGRLFETAIVGVAYVILLPLIGTPYPFLVAVVMTVSELIPILGPLLGTGGCVLIICTQSPLHVIWFALASFAIQQIDNSFIGPRILGNAIGLKGIWIMLSITIGSALFGVLGVLLSAPVFSVFYLLIRDFIDGKLRKKGRSTATEDYTDMFASRVPQHAQKKSFFHFFKRKKKEDIPPPPNGSHQ